MNRDEILAKSRKEHKGGDLVQLEIQSKSRGIAGVAALLLGATINLIGTVAFDRRFPEFWIMFFGYAAAQGISEFVLCRRSGRRKSGILGLAYGIFMMSMTAVAVITLCGTWWRADG